MGVFFWGWQLVRSYSPKYSSLPRVSPRDAGEFNSGLFINFNLRVRLALSNLLHLKILKGPSVNCPSRPCSEGLFSFVKSVISLLLDILECNQLLRIARMKLDSVQPLSLVR
jgi:hypothetical protein